MEENVELAASEQLPPPSPSEWFDIWVDVVTKPNVQTYRWIARWADVKTAYIWLAIAYLAVIVILMVLAGAVMLLVGIDAYDDMGLEISESMGMMVVFGCCGSLGYTVLEVAMFSLVTAISNAIARAFGGVGDFRQLLYCTAAYTVPITIVSAILGALAQIPCVGIVIGLVSLALGIYTIVLNVVAIKAVHQIETWQAVLSSTLMLGLVLVVVIGILALLGPTVGNVFSNIIEGLDAGY